MGIIMDNWGQSNFQQFGVETTLVVNALSTFVIG